MRLHKKRSKTLPKKVRFDYSHNRKKKSKDNFDVIEDVESSGEQIHQDQDPTLVVDSQNHNRMIIKMPGIVIIKEKGKPKQTNE